MSNKVLVAYFSVDGKTEDVAKRIAQFAKGDLFEIKPTVPYTAADLDWNDKNSRTSVEMRNLTRPEIAGRVQNMADYDTVFVGFPIWWYTAPTIIYGFLEGYDFAGKTVIPFATSGGSDIRKAEAVLKPLCSPKTVWVSGKLVNDVSDAELSAWVKEAAE